MCNGTPSLASAMMPDAVARGGRRIAPLFSKVGQRLGALIVGPRIHDLPIMSVTGTSMPSRVRLARHQLLSF